MEDLSKDPHITDRTNHGIYRISSTSKLLALFLLFKKIQIGHSDFIRNIPK